MKHFLSLTLYFLVPIGAAFGLAFLLPPTPHSLQSYNFASQKQDSILIHTSTPRIIFVGGSNLCFGLNSYMVKQALALNPVNTGLHGGVTPRYMFENTLRHIKKGDVIILALEYDHFYTSYDPATPTLFEVISYAWREKIELLSWSQIIQYLKFVPKFAANKFMPTLYFNPKPHLIYNPYSFNQYGDNEVHWNSEKNEYTPITLKGKWHPEVIAKVKAFENRAKDRGARVYVTFPSFDEVSFANSKVKIQRVEKALHDYNFNILGSASRYAMPKEMMFDGHYHLNKKGLDYRTKLFIEDYKKYKDKAK